VRTNTAALRGIPVTREQVIRATGKFDLDATQDDWLSNRAQKYVLIHEGKRYPPKKVLSIATHVPVRAFHGGREANGVLRSLGFEVVPKAAAHPDFKEFLRGRA
jgi:5-methylcytosine-specific restriction protein A